PGLPNAGKSSVLNALLGRGAVGVSRAPGRTRYFQTHFLTPTVRLCGCSERVCSIFVKFGIFWGEFMGFFWGFPWGFYWVSCGIILGFSVSFFGGFPMGFFWGFLWDFFEISCGIFWGFSPPAWAEKRGYKTARAARNDVARAANGILRLAAEGRLRLCMTPLGYTA
ncbi:GNL1 protein, partial [Dicrurus megarhynchus]|nr:GNL1 protein [Dicrurus megarhynchus]